MKQVTFNVNPLDLRFVLKVLFERIIQREATARKNAVESLDEYINEAKCDEIIIALKQHMEAQARCAQELSELSTIVELIRASNAEVLKDLPDLEKDSL